jgi:hypothetical protein
VAESVGVGACLLCPNTEAKASVSVRGWACLTCNRCKAQFFARGPQSDELLRDRFRREGGAPAQAPAPAAAPAPVRGPAPTASSAATVQAPAGNPFLIG